MDFFLEFNESLVFCIASFKTKSWIRISIYQICYRLLIYNFLLLGFCVRKFKGKSTSILIFLSTIRLTKCDNYVVTSASTLNILSPSLDICNCFVAGKLSLNPRYLCYKSI